MHNGVEYGGGGYSKKQTDDKLRLKLDKSAVDTEISEDSSNPVQNRVIANALNDKISQVNVMPTPSENELDKIVQYVGETTGSYIKGFFYRCVEVPDTDPTEYEWVHQNVDEISGDAVVWVTNFPTAPDIKNVVYGKITTTTEYTNEKTVGLDSLDTETRITLDGDSYIPASADDVYVKGGDVSDYETFVSFNTVTNELTTSEGTYTLETETELTFATQTTTETKSFKIGNEERQELTELESGGTEVIANPSEAATETLSKVNIDGTVYEVGGDTIQVETLPTASADELGNIYEYVGTTTANYINGRFYRCVSGGTSTPTYVWEEVDFGDGTPHWSGTRAEYEAIKDTLEPGTYVSITDDYDEGLEVVDEVEDNNMNVVTSNAVYEALSKIGDNYVSTSADNTDSSWVTKSVTVSNLPKGKYLVFGKITTDVNAGGTAKTAVLSYGWGSITFSQATGDFSGNTGLLDVYNHVSDGTANFTIQIYLNPVGGKATAQLMLIRMA